MERIYEKPVEPHLGYIPPEAVVQEIVIPELAILI
jgi:hypothetical protein